MTSYDIRAGRAGDSERLFPLVAAFATSYVCNRSAFESSLQAILESQGSLLLVVDQSGGLIGYAVAARYPTLFANGEITQLLELFVEPEYRGRGVGRQLVGAIELAAREAGAVELTVPTRRASEFYEKLGFEATAAFLKKRISRSVLDSGCD